MPSYFDTDFVDWAPCSQQQTSPEAPVYLET